MKVIGKGNIVKIPKDLKILTKRRNKFGKIYKMMQKFYFVIFVTGFNSDITKKDAAAGDINIFH
jgi:hypothetical protein